MEAVCMRLETVLARSDELAAQLPNHDEAQLLLLCASLSVVETVAQAADNGASCVEAVTAALDQLLMETAR